MQKHEEHRDYYSVRITAEVMGVSRSTVFRYIKSGKLEALTYKGDYYVCQEDLDAYWIDSHASKEWKDRARGIIRGLISSVREDRSGTAPRRESGISGSGEEG